MSTYSSILHNVEILFLSLSLSSQASSCPQAVSKSGGGRVQWQTSSYPPNTNCILVLQKHFHFIANLDHICAEYQSHTYCCAFWNNL